MKSELAKIRSMAAWISGQSCWCWPLRSASGMVRDEFGACVGDIHESSFIFQFADAASRSRRISCNHCVGRNVTSYDGARAYERSLADNDAGKKRRVGSDLGEAADSNALQRVFGSAALWEAGVGDDYPRAEPAVVFEHRILGHEAL